MADQYMADAEFLRTLIVENSEFLAPATLARLSVLWSRYRGFDAGMGDLCRRAFEAHHAAVERTEEANDRAYLKSLIEGTRDVLSEETFPRMKCLFAKYPEGSEMFAILERAATVFGDAAQEVAAWALASGAIDDARRRAGSGDVDE
jgi:hypothetical protein